MSFTRTVKKTNQIAVLQSAGARLITELSSQFNTANVLYTLDLDAEGAKRHNLFATLTPMDGAFQPELDGGGRFVCIEQTGILFTIWSRQVTDPPGRAEHVLLGIGEDAERSLLKIKHLILMAFAGHMLLDPQDQRDILTENMQPVSAKTPVFDNIDRQGKLASLSIGFSVAFQWDLT